MTSRRFAVPALAADNQAMNSETLMAALPAPSGSHWWLLGSAVLVLLTLWIMLRAGRHLRQRRYGRAATRGLAAGVLGGFTALVLLLGVNLLTYTRLTAERPVAQVRFSEAGPQRYMVRLQTADGRTLLTELNGDDWQLDARVVKWTGLGTLLGLPPLYRLERLSGRYENLQQARSQVPGVVGLSRDPGLALTDLNRYARWMPLEDARYGSATYLPMANGAEYAVSLSNTGLLARPSNEAARQALAHWR